MDKERSMDGAAESRADKVKRQAEEKRKRLAEELRVNLHRRKAQSRARAEAPEPLAGDASDETSEDQ